MFTLGHNRPEIAVFLEELAAVAENLIPKRVRDQVVAGAAKLPSAYNERHYKLMVSLREDFVSKLDGLSKDMPSVMHNRHSLSHMTGEQALDVVMKPGGELVNKAVARRIVRFVAAANDVEAVISNADTETFNLELRNLRIKPALLSLVCRELNLQRIKEERSEITLEQVQRSSDQILDDFYERSLEGLQSPDRRFIEDRLVTVSGFRTTVPVEEAIQADLTDDEIELLVERRLLRKEDRLGTPHIELTHDVLTKAVLRSRNIRKEKDEQEAKLAAEEEDRKIWETKQKQEAENRKLRELERRKRLAIIRNAIAAMSIILLCVAIGLFFWWRTVTNDQRLADARNLAFNGSDVGLRNPELVLLLSVEAGYIGLQEDDNKIAKEIETALRTATWESLTRKRYEGQTADVYSVDFDREGRRLVTSGAAPDSTARIWDVETNQEIARLDHGAMPGGEVTVSSARFSPDGRRIVTTTYRQDGDVYIWDADVLRKTEGGVLQVVTKPLVTFNGHHARTATAAFSPDGKMVASGGYDKLIRLWDPTSGTELLAAPLGSGRTHHTARIRSLCFNADGEQLLSTSDDGNTILWDLRAALTAEKQHVPATLEAIRIFPASAQFRLSC